MIPVYIDIERENYHNMNLWQENYWSSLKKNPWKYPQCLKNTEFYKLFQWRWGNILALLQVYKTISATLKQSVTFLFWLVIQNETWGFDSDFSDVNDIELGPSVTCHGIINTGAISDLKSLSCPLTCPKARQNIFLFFQKDLSSLFLNIFDDGDSTTSLFSTSEIRQVSKNSEIFFGMLVVLRMNSNLPADFARSTPKCKCPWCRQELDWGFYGKRDLIPITVNSSLNPKKSINVSEDIHETYCCSIWKRGLESVPLIKLVGQEVSFGLNV